MSLISYRSVAAALSAALVPIFLCGCGVTLNPVKRKPLQITPMAITLASNPQRILVHFESSIPGRPLDETVWDNVSGAFWSITESKQIGYTQDYSKFIPVAITSGAIGGGVGGAIVGVAAAPQLVDTRIVIPFGRIFEEVFQSGLQETFPHSVICHDDSSEPEKLKTDAPQYLVRIKVTEFYVWEQPLNHINLKATGRTRIYRANATDTPEFVYESHSEMTNQPVGTMMSTSSGFIKEMNKISNRLAANLSTEILQTLQKKINP